MPIHFTLHRVLLAAISIVGSAVIVPPAAGQEPTPAATVAARDEHVTLQPWTGDYDGMVERRLVRILVPYSRTHFFLDGATQRGVVAALGRELGQEINRRERLRTRLVHVVFVPVPRDRRFAWLTEGRGDIVAGELTIGDGREAAIAFTTPWLRNAREIVVTGPGAPQIETLADLEGQQVYVQASSRYLRSLRELSDRLAAAGGAPIAIESADEMLETDEVLELVHAGVYPISVVDEHLASLWSEIFPDLTVRSDLVVASGRDHAWAFRRGSPLLEEMLNEFLTPRRHRTKFGNIVFRRYLQNTNWIRDVQNTTDRQRYALTMPLFEKFGARYDLDPLFLLALGYQESRLDQSVRSHAGAIGVMQVLPATGEYMDVGDITQLEPNIHAGTRYLRHLTDGIAGADVDPLNRMLFALASYNGGQTRIRRL